MAKGNGSISSVDINGFSADLSPKAVDLSRKLESLKESQREIEKQLAEILKQRDELKKEILAVGAMVKKDIDRTFSLYAQSLMNAFNGFRDVDNPIMQEAVDAKVSLLRDLYVINNTFNPEEEIVILSNRMAVNVSQADKAEELLREINKPLPNIKEVKPEVQSVPKASKPSAAKASTSIPKARGRKALSPEIKSNKAFITKLEKELQKLEADSLKKEGILEPAINGKEIFVNLLPEYNGLYTAVKILREANESNLSLVSTLDVAYLPEDMQADFEKALSSTTYYKKKYSEPQRMVSENASLIEGLKGFLSNLESDIQNHVGVAIPKSSIDSFEPLSIESHVLRDNILEMIDILKDSKGQLTNVWKLGNVKRTHVNRFKELVKDSYKALAVVAPTFMAVSTVKDNLEVLKELNSGFGDFYQENVDNLERLNAYITRYNIILSSIGLGASRLKKASDGVLIDKNLISEYEQSLELLKEKTVQEVPDYLKSINLDFKVNNDILYSSNTIASLKSFIEAKIEEQRLATLARIKETERSEFVRDLVDRYFEELKQGMFNKIVLNPNYIKQKSEKPKVLKRVLELPPGREERRVNRASNVTTDKVIYLEEKSFSTVSEEQLLLKLKEIAKITDEDEMAKAIADLIGVSISSEVEQIIEEYKDYVPKDGYDYVLPQTRAKVLLELPSSRIETKLQELGQVKSVLDPNKIIELGAPSVLRVGLLELPPSKKEVKLKEISESNQIATSTNVIELPSSSIFEPKVSEPTISQTTANTAAETLKESLDKPPVSSISQEASGVVKAKTVDELVLLIESYNKGAGVVNAPSAISEESQEKVSLITDKLQAILDIKDAKVRSEAIRNFRVKEPDISVRSVENILEEVHNYYDVVFNSENKELIANPLSQHANKLIALLYSVNPDDRKRLISELSLFSPEGSRELSEIIDRVENYNRVPVEPKKKLTEKELSEKLLAALNSNDENQLKDFSIFGDLGVRRINPESSTFDYNLLTPATESAVIANFEPDGGLRYKLRRLTEKASGKIKAKWNSLVEVGLKNCSPEMTAFDTTKQVLNNIRTQVDDSLNEATYGGDSGDLSVPTLPGEIIANSANCTPEKAIENYRFVIMELSSYLDKAREAVDTELDRYPNHLCTAKKARVQDLKLRINLCKERIALLLIDYYDKAKKANDNNTAKRIAAYIFSLTYVDMLVYDSLEEAKTAVSSMMSLTDEELHSELVLSRQAIESVIKSFPKYGVDERDSYYLSVLEGAINNLSNDARYRLSDSLPYVLSRKV